MGWDGSRARLIYNGYKLITIIYAAVGKYILRRGGAGTAEDVERFWNSKLRYHQGYRVQE